MKLSSLLYAALPVLLVTAFAASIAAAADVLVIRNVTVIDVSDHGLGTADIADAVVVVRGERITAVGPASSTPIPHDSQVIDGGGGFLVPGLIDCFAALNHQAQANAYLAMGVTTILGVDGQGNTTHRADLSGEVANTDANNADNGGEYDGDKGNGEIFEGVGIGVHGINGM